MGRFFGKMTQTITQRWHAFHHTTGSGHLFQGRFKTFLVQTDAHFVQLMKYIEANPLRANLVNRAEDWKWGSLYARTEKTNCASKILKAWPVDMPSDYIDEVNRPLPKMIIEQIRESVIRGRPLGDEIWVNGAIGRYKLEYTIRQRGGQRKFD